MIGDSFTGKYPEDEKRIMHADVQGLLDDYCSGELEEFTEKPSSWPPRVFYRCLECGKELSGSDVLLAMDDRNADRDISDWEYNYELYC